MRFTARVVDGFQRQQSYRRRFAGRTPGWADSVVMFRRCIAETARPDMRILDLGCGHLGLHGDGLACANGADVVGVEPDAPALQRNAVLHVRICADGEALPFAGASGDIVASAGW